MRSPRPFPPQEGWSAADSPLVADDEISLLDLWRVINRYKKHIITIVAGFTIAAIAYALMSPPMYRAEVTLVPAFDDGGATTRQLGELSSLAGLTGLDLGGRQDSTAVALATLRSREFTDRFLKEAGVLPVLQQAQEKSVDDIAPSESKLAWQAYKQFDQGIRSIRIDRPSGIVTLAIEWTDPKLAAQWANELIERLNRHMQTEAIKEAEKSITYLNQQLALTSVVELQQAIYRLIEGQVKQIVLANVHDEYAFKIIDPAKVPEERFKPQRRLIVILGVLLGLMVGLLTAFTLRMIEKYRS